MTQFNQALSYDDVLLTPQYSDIESRSEVSLESELDKDNKFRASNHCKSNGHSSGTEMAIALADWRTWRYSSV